MKMTRFIIGIVVAILLAFSIIAMGVGLIQEHERTKARQHQNRVDDFIEKALSNDY